MYLYVCLYHIVPDMVMASTAKMLDIQPSEATKVHVCFNEQFSKCACAAMILLYVLVNLFLVFYQCHCDKFWNPKQIWIWWGRFSRFMNVPNFDKGVGPSQYLLAPKTHNSFFPSDLCHEGRCWWSSCTNHGQTTFWSHMMGVVLICMTVTLYASLTLLWIISVLFAMIGFLRWSQGVAN